MLRFQLSHLLLTIHAFGSTKMLKVSQKGGAEECSGTAIGSLSGETDVISVFLLINGCKRRLVNGAKTGEARTSLPCWNCTGIIHRDKAIV